uniref:DNA polymerase alpha catalytic subunit n=1 Tax=Myxine glutinosa TaxID=7769 RepID=UPI00358F10A1
MEVDGMSGSLATTRSRREKKGRSSRQTALEQLRKAKAGEKVKYEVEAMNNVYDEVDEEEYSRRVRNRQDDEWIVDDGGCGYVEDGREIFDEDLRDDALDDDRRKTGDKKKNEKDDVKKQTVMKPNNIKAMFMASASKKTEREVDLSKDDLLGDILQDLKSESLSPSLVPIKKKRLPNPFSTRRNIQASWTENTMHENCQTASSVRRSLLGSDCASHDSFTKHPQPASLTSHVSRHKQNFDEKGRNLPRNVPLSANNRLSAKPSIKHGEEEMNTVQDLEELPDVDFDEPMEAVKIEQEETSKHALKEVRHLESQVQPHKQDVKPERPIWEWAGSEEQLLPTSSDLQLQPGTLPTVTSPSGEQVFRFFWLDAYEDPYNQPGVVYLFGKVWVETAKKHVSCCLTVRNIERCIYLLPRAKRLDHMTGKPSDSVVSMKDVYDEFNNKFAEKFKIMRFKSKKVQKWYAFDPPGVPSDYLEIRYAAEFPALPMNISGETFSRAFGTNTSCLELLLISRRFKGPSWIDVASPQVNKQAVSWCHLDVLVDRPEFLTVVQDIPPPHLVVMSLAMKTLPNKKTHQHEVISFAALLHTSFPVDRAAPQSHFQTHFSALSKPADFVFPFDHQAVFKSSKMNVEICLTERILLAFLLSKVHEMDPDVIVGHDIIGFDLDVLLQRMAVCKVPHWSKIGRIKRTTMPRIAGKMRMVDKAVTSGRVICDVKTCARELIRSKGYDLSELARFVLRVERKVLPQEDIPAMFNASRQLLCVPESTLCDAELALRLACDLNILPLAMQITNIAGNLLARTLQGGRSERNEFLLLHAFHEKNFIVPDKHFNRKAMQEPMVGEEGEGTSGKPHLAKKKAAYAGGLVLEPKVGFYDTFILLLDFNSLYPSIIQEYNICFSTVDRGSASGSTAKTQGEADSEGIPALPSSDVPKGVLPTEIRKLVERRRQVKQLMKQHDLDADVRMQYDIRQKALKLTANSMYGCLGFSFSRFYAKPLAALITHKGREILMHTKELVQKMNLDVIYGDTDSIMINSNSRNYDEVLKLGNRVKAEVNKCYRLLEIDVDNVFSSMLLLKKKKYAALAVEHSPDGTMQTRQELKGLDIVRRDWCDLAKSAGNFVINQILSNQPRDAILETIQTHLTEIGQQVVSGKIALRQYEINKGLTKDPQDYPDKKTLPHVHVALWLNSQGGRPVKAGDTISYIICKDGSNLPASQRAYSPQQLNQQPSLTVDTHYYLGQQLHPVILRLCDPIEGIDSAILAQWLGLDPSQFRVTQNMTHTETDALLGGTAQLSDVERYRDCKPFIFSCPKCRANNEFTAPFMDSDKTNQPDMGVCIREGCTECLFCSSNQMKNKLELDIRNHIQRYYVGLLVCEEPTCGHRTRRLPLRFSRSGPTCMACQSAILRPEYTDNMLYNQLNFYETIFDWNRIAADKPQQRKVPDCGKAHNAKQLYDELQEIPRTALAHNSYSEIDLAKLFQCMV